MTLRRIPTFKIKTNEQIYNNRLNYLKDKQKLLSINKDALLLPDESGFFKKPLEAPDFLIRDIEAETTDITTDDVTKIKKNFRDEMLKLAPLTIVDNIISNPFYTDEIIYQLMTLWPKFKKDLLKNFSIIDINTFNEYVKEYLTSDKIAVSSVEKSITDLFNKIKIKKEIIKQKILKKKSELKKEEERIKKIKDLEEKNKAQLIFNQRKQKFLLYSKEYKKKQLITDKAQQELQTAIVNNENKEVIDKAQQELQTALEDLPEFTNMTMITNVEDTQEEPADLTNILSQIQTKNDPKKEARNKQIQENKKKSEDFSIQMMKEDKSSQIEKFKKEQFKTTNIYSELMDDKDNLKKETKSEIAKKYGVNYDITIPNLKIRMDEIAYKEFEEQFKKKKEEDKIKLNENVFYDKYPKETFGEGINKKNFNKNNKRYLLLKAQILSGNDNAKLLKEIKKYKK